MAATDSARGKTIPNPVKRRVRTIVIAVVAGAAVVVSVLIHHTRRDHNALPQSRADGAAKVLSPSSKTPRPSSDARVEPDASARRTDMRPANEWTAKFHQSRNYFDFVSHAADAAFRGDGRAAFYVGRATLDCELTVRKYRGHADPAAEFSIEQSKTNAAPQWYRDQQAERFERCRGLIDGDPFAQLPPRTSGYGYRYWLDRAVDSGDPVAGVDRAFQQMGRAAELSGDDREGMLEHVRNAIGSAIASQDPEAIFKLGVLLTDPRYSPDPLNGLAMALAACDLGYDCSATNPDNPFTACKATAACPGDADFTYYAQQSLGPDRFAQAYAKAQEFKDALAKADMAILQNFVKIKKQSSSADWKSPAPALPTQTAIRPAGHRAN